MSISKGSRKQAIDEYKNRKPRRGVFVLRCDSTGHAWVGASRDLNAARNGLWFVLRTGTNRNPELQAEWRAHGEEHFQFEVLEELDPDESPLLVNDLLEEKKRAHALKEHAQTLLP
jgi:hypothetical protein